MTSSSNRDAWQLLNYPAPNPSGGNDPHLEHRACMNTLPSEKTIQIFTDHLQFSRHAIAILLTNVGGPIYPAGRGNELSRSACSTCQCRGLLPNSPALHFAGC